MRAEKTRRLGRAPGSPPNKEAILDAARDYFERHGYERATIRAIAAQARVDPALVHHYFGSKDDLLVAALELPINPRDVVAELLEGDRSTIGERLLRRVLGVWGAQWSKGGPLVGLIRTAMTHEDSARMMREFFSRELIGRLADALEVDRPRLRVGLVASQLMGLAAARFIIRIEPIVSADPETLIAAYAPTIQRYLTGPLGSPPVSPLESRAKPPPKSPRPSRAPKNRPRSRRP